jgi:hypothetical protein
MTKADRDTRNNRTGGAAKSSMLDRDVAAKAVLDNMARLKALRLEREAAAPPKAAAAPKKARANPKKSAEKAPALGEWLAGRQSGGHRT